MRYVSGESHWSGITGAERHCAACAVEKGARSYGGRLTIRDSALGIVCAVCVLAAACGRSKPSATSAVAEQIYRGGAILTLNEAQPRAEALAVSGGRIVGVGTQADMETLAGFRTRHVDPGDRALMPGFVDPHGHASLIGLQAVSANLLPAPDGKGNDSSPPGPSI